VTGGFRNVSARQYLNYVAGNAFQGQEMLPAGPFDGKEVAQHIELAHDIERTFRFRHDHAGNGVFLGDLGRRMRADRGRLSRARINPLEPFS
jgi:hypothetical protein